MSLEWRWETFVFAIISFGILYWLLNRYAFGPLFATMEKRKEMMQNDLQSAEQSRNDAAQFLEQQRQALEQARKEAYEMLEQAKLTSMRQAEATKLQAEQDTTRMKAEAIREIESEKNKAVATLRNQVSAMSVMIASKIIEKQIDEKSQQQLVERYLTEVGGNNQ